MDFQQYYPTYNYKERDIVLLEFEEAQKIANTQSKLYGQFASIFLTFATIGMTLFIKTVDKLSIEVTTILKDNLILINILFGLIAFVILRYFVEIQRTIVINCRKVITLRRMLGLDYGELQLTIPNWRVEGATNPFVVKLFPGWFKFGSSPFWIIAITINLFWYLSSNIIDSVYINSYWYIISIGLTLFYALIFKIQLNETHETFYLNSIKIISKILRINLVSDFEYIIYRMKLSVYEKRRLKYNTDNIGKILQKIEDNRFYSHNGIDFRALVRSLFTLSKRYRKKKGMLKSGGSTITMQLCRTQFIPINQNPFFRKIVEMLLAIWMEKQFQKDELLEYYLTCVRFERGIYGIISASKYFFKNKKAKEHSNEEAFFLIERLSNITSTFRIDRLKSLYNRISEDIEISWENILELYGFQSEKKLIIQFNND